MNKSTVTGNVSVGKDPTKFVTRPMRSHMINISEKIHKILVDNRSLTNLTDVDLCHHFDHCTVLIYYADSSKKRKSSIV